MRSENVLMLAGRIIGSLGSGVLILWGALVGLNEALFHGFADTCSDGHPEFDPESCGITWTVGLPYLAVSALGLALLAAFVWKRAFTRIVVALGGLTAILSGFSLLLLTTWYPVNSLYPEPAWPQIVLLTIGALAILAAILSGSRKATGSTESQPAQSDLLGR